MFETLCFLPSLYNIHEKPHTILFSSSQYYKIIKWIYFDLYPQRNNVTETCSKSSYKRDPYFLNKKNIPHNQKESLLCWIWCNFFLFEVSQVRLDIGKDVISKIILEGGKYCYFTIYITILLFFSIALDLLKQSE